MKIRKSIAYAYPTSPRAVELGVRDRGGYYVEQSVQREDGTWSTGYVADGCGNEAFSSPDDSDLISLYLEADGTACPMFVQHGNAAALAAIYDRIVRSVSSNKGV
jgi:hypothetical protein